MLSCALLLATILSVVSSLTEDTALASRQEPGSPGYECHANCGSIITMSRSEGFCDSEDFRPALDACLDCAEQFDIWQIYGDKVSAAAEQCGLEATPRPADEGSSQTSAPTSEASGMPTESAAMNPSETSAGSASMEPSSSVEESASPTGDSQASQTSGNSAHAQRPARGFASLSVGALVAFGIMW